MKKLHTLCLHLLISGVLSGLAFYFLVRLALLPGAPSLNMNPNPSQWFPGLVFGIFLARVNKWATHTFVSFCSLASIIYFCAYTCAYTVVSHLGWGVLTLHNDAKYYGTLAFAGCFSGAMGAWSLGYITRIFTARKPKLAENVYLVCTGAVTGATFLLVLGKALLIGEQNYLIAAPVVAFTLWQLPVGLCLQEIIDRGASTHNLSATDERIAKVLQGPTVQLLGLIGTIIGIISFLAAK